MGNDDDDHAATARTAVRGGGIALWGPGDVVVRTERMRGVAVDVGRADHVDALLAWFNDPAVGRWMADPEATYTRADVVRMFTIEGDGDADSLALVFEEAQTGALVGYGSVYDWDTAVRSCEVSFLVGDGRRRGQGLGRETVGALLAVAFGCGAHSVLATAVVDNATSLRSLRANGFAAFGLRHDSHRVGGKYYDEEYLECFEEAFRQRVPAATAVVPPMRQQ
eukprot:m51a1_g10304 putative gcn5-related n-acetyltransferase (223) ;mRNA; f:70328-71356